MCEIVTHYGITKTKTSISTKAKLKHCFSVNKYKSLLLVMIC